MEMKMGVVEATKEAFSDPWTAYYTLWGMAIGSCFLVLLEIVGVTI